MFDNNIWQGKDSIGSGSCNADGACQSLKATIGDTSCNIEDACKLRVGDVGDNLCNSASGVCECTTTGTCTNPTPIARRLGFSPNNESKAIPAPTTPHKLIEVGFGSSSATASAGRRLQTNDDATPVNEFDVAVDLASPPGRSAATGASLAMAYASLMVGGIVGVVMF